MLLASTWSTIYVNDPHGHAYDDDDDDYDDDMMMINVIKINHMMIIQHLSMGSSCIVETVMGNALSQWNSSFRMEIIIFADY